MLVVMINYHKNDEPPNRVLHKLKNKSIQIYIYWSVYSQVFSATYIIYIHTYIVEYKTIQNPLKTSLHSAHSGWFVVIPTKNPLHTKWFSKGIHEKEKEKRKKKKI